MRISLESPEANTVRAWSPGEIRVGEQVIRNHVILTADRIIEPWEAGDPRTLATQALAPVLALAPEIILLGTGDRIVFPETALAAEVLSRGIGFEVMDTAAACRTFNILVNEQRRVAAALILR